VTTRTLPQRTGVLPGLSQVTPHVTGSHARQDLGPCNAVCTRPLPAGHVSHGANRRTPSLGAMAHPMDRLHAGSAIDANAACRGGQQQLGTKREWCPVSLVVPATPRRSGRTETLT